MQSKGHFGLVGRQSIGTQRQEGITFAARLDWDRAKRGSAQKFFAFLLCGVGFCGNCNEQQMLPLAMAHCAPRVPPTSTCGSYLQAFVSVGRPHAGDAHAMRPVRWHSSNMGDGLRMAWRRLPVWVLLGCASG